DTAQFAHDFRKALGDSAGGSGRESAVETILLAGSPGRRIVDLAREGRYDLVGLGSARRSGVSRALLGSTASEVIEALPCDVLIGGTGGVRSPVTASTFGLNGEPDGHY
ncbi:MAG: universal stress protein, partial [Alphaproteobacteria bacterium]